MTPIHEDEKLNELGGFDSGNFPSLDTLDEDDDDIGDDDLSSNILVICVEPYLIFCYLVMVVCEGLELLVWLPLFSIVT